ncbi:FEKKY domain-containing protein [Flavobacterium muglaense]|uniref:DUF4369 domain-containing protein n=1 Tax=Flavobacterium muglaense TaxID=2764716 RepID=A0A923MYN7_9FLAO|nr:hypothetical protein [Flavobacterium muglaense]MBC5837708.1 hypothetical protein [Flavobacterium muglaense]MBC5844176.1 hypothetical protein [Flavobacterium muglaense]
MKNTILTIVLAFFFSSTFANEIQATVVFENFTSRQFTSGEFTIMNSNHKIEIAKAESFTISLPEKGKYNFSFVSDDFFAYVTYPTRLTTKENTITIRLTEKTKLFIDGTIDSVVNSSNTNLSNEQLEQRISKGTLNFIIHGINNSVPEEYVVFKKKYGIGLVKENCLTEPISLKKAVANNRMIFKYLNGKYGTTWLTELEIKPFGLQ